MLTNSKVYINNITEQNLLQTIKDGLEFIESDKIINKDSTIFIKPNLTDSTHKPGITTTPIMIKTVLEAFSPMVKKIYIGESDGGNYSYSADTSLENHGVYNFSKLYDNVEVVNLTKLPRTRVKENVCGKTVWVDLPNLLLNDIDCLVSVPVLKTHAMTYGTYSIKNLWGCYPDPMRLLYHKNLDYKLALINKLCKNHIQIIDGFWALDGHGPMEGTPKPINKILVSNDPVAVDSTAAYIMNLDTKKITHLGISKQYGLGISDIDKITYNDNINTQKLEKFKPYKIKLDYLNLLLFNSEIMAKVVLSSPITPIIYTILNFIKPREKRTYWAEYNKQKYRFN